MLQTTQYLISGKVQGVGFRYLTAQKAEKIALKGWVENLPDGRVRIVAQGTTSQHDALISWLSNGGVSYARIAEIKAESFQTDSPLSKFYIRR